MNSLNNNSATGGDKITVKLIKICHIHLVEPLKHIINLIFSTECVPQHFKESIITPGYKNRSRTDKSNYRPISVINNLAKFLKKH